MCSTLNYTVGYTIENVLYYRESWADSDMEQSRMAVTLLHQDKMTYLHCRLDTFFVSLNLFFVSCWRHPLGYVEQHYGTSRSHFCFSLARYWYQHVSFPAFLAPSPDLLSTVFFISCERIVGWSLLSMTLTAVVFFLTSFESLVGFFCSFDTFR